MYPLWCNVLGFDVSIHRPRWSIKRVKQTSISRSNNQQTSTPDTEPQSPGKSLSPHSPYNCSGRCLINNLKLQTTQFMCCQNPVRNGPVTPSHQSRSHGGWIYPRWLSNILRSGKDVLSFDFSIHRPRGNEEDKLPSRVEPRSNDK